MMKKLTPIIAIAAGGIAGCGGGDDAGPDRSEPASVAEAFMTSFYHCGAKGAGVRAELAYPESAASEHRAEVAEEEKPGGCQEEQPKDYTTAPLTRPEPTIPIAIKVDNEDCDGNGVVPMIEVDGQWRVNEDEVSPVLIC